MLTPYKEATKNSKQEKVVTRYVKLLEDFRETPDAARITVEKNKCFGEPCGNETLF